MTTALQEESGGSLNWAVRDSFLRYVTVIAGGSYTAQGVELDAHKRFEFPLMQAANQGAEWHFWFDGSVNFQAHQGFLDVTIERPEITIGPEGGVLSTQTEDGLLHIAELGAVSPEISGNTVSWKGVPSKLLPTGVPLFGDVYEAGAEFSAVSFTATLVRS